MTLKTRRTAVIAAVAGVVVLGGAVAAGATALRGEDENGDSAIEDAREGEDQAITGSALERAEAAALDHLGEGTVSATEVDDEESYYEVEVTLDDGSQVDVQLDKDFQVVDTS